MVEVLERFDRTTAAGILSRAALALGNDANPAAAPVVEGEPLIRRRLFIEARQQIGLPADDNTPGAREQLEDFLDNESDALLGPIDSATVLRRLSESGELPSDLYEIEIIKNVAAFHGRKFAHETKLIEATIRAPDYEQHYGPPADPLAPCLLSLFVKIFPDKYPARSFLMLVAGAREGMRLTVHQAWRLYPEEVNLAGAKTPIEMLRRFATAFGYDVEFAGQRGPFILLAEIPPGQEIPNLIRWPQEHGPGRIITITYFWQPRPANQQERAALVTAIDLDRYRDVLMHYGW